MPSPERLAPRVSVIMRSKNSDWVIGEALAALFSQRFRNFELLIVDSGSTDRTLDIVRQYPHRLIRIEPDEYHPGRVLNTAIAQSRSEILVFQNSDAVPLTNTTLERLVAAFDDVQVQAALARQLPRPDAAAWVRQDYARSFPDTAHTPAWITLSLPMAAMRRTAWEQHPFYIDCWGSEDTEWGHWARSHGLQVRYVQDALIMHSHNYTLRQLYGRRFIEGEADAFIYRSEAGLATMLRGVARSCVGDLSACLVAGDYGAMPMIAARRAVYHWSYYQGLRLGRARIRGRNRDSGTGQRIVLTRHESVR